MVNCTVQRSKFDESLEILTSKYTKVETSPKQFILGDTHVGLGSSEDSDQPLLGYKEIDGDIVAVLGMDEYLSCISCKSKVKELNNTIGECACKIKISRCKKSVNVRFIVEGKEGKTWHLTAFNEQVQGIVTDENGVSLEEQMLMTSNMKFFITRNDVVKSIEKN